MPLDDLIGGLSHGRPALSGHPFASTCATIAGLTAAYVERLDQAAAELGGILHERYADQFNAYRCGIHGNIAITFPMRIGLESDRLLPLAARHQLAIGNEQKLKVRSHTYKLIADGRHVVASALREKSPFAPRSQAERIIIFMAHPRAADVLQDLLESYYRIPQR
jgi:hypothetical protein